MLLERKQNSWGKIDTLVLAEEKSPNDRTRLHLLEPLLPEQELHIISGKDGAEEFYFLG